MRSVSEIRFNCKQILKIKCSLSQTNNSHDLDFNVLVLTQTKYHWLLDCAVALSKLQWC